MRKHRRMKDLQQREIKSEKEDGLSSKNRLILHEDFAKIGPLFSKMPFRRITEKIHKFLFLHRCVMSERLLRVLA